MPTILRSGPYRVYTWSHESNEPAHVHIDRDDLTAKFWLQPIELATNAGFRPVELRRIQRMLETHEHRLVRAWITHHES